MSGGKFVDEKSSSMSYLDFYGGYRHYHFHLQFLSMTKYENISSVEIQVAGSNKKPTINLYMCLHANFHFF